MPDPNKKPYDPNDKANRWPKALYHPKLPMRTVADADAAEKLIKEDRAWREQPYHAPDGTPLKEGRSRGDEDRQSSREDDKKSEDKKQDDKKDK